jgi:hypothetical protein
VWTKLDNPGEFWENPDDPNSQTVYSGFRDDLKSPNGVHHNVELIETIKMHIWIAQFELRMKEL